MTYLTPQKAVIASLIGGWFGFMLLKSRVFEPVLIHGQFEFSLNIMLRMFLSAAGTSALIFGVFDQLSFTRKRMRELRAPVFKRIPAPPAALFGGAMIGAGMALARACPGTAFVQLGHGFGGYTLVGGFVGSLIFAMVEPHVRSARAYCRYPNFPVTVDQFLKTSQLTAALIYSAMFFTIVAMIELFSPYWEDLPEGVPVLFKSDLSAFLVYAWPPYLAGVLLGLAQIPLFFIFKDSLGASGGVACLLSWIVKRISPKFWKKYPAIGSSEQFSWQIFFLLGAMVSSFIFAAIDGTHGPRHNGLAIEQFIGGIILYFGARFAGGCTSGNGISGNGFLSISSLFATVGMFGAGILITILFYPGYFD